MDGQLTLFGGIFLTIFVGGGGILFLLMLLNFLVTMLGMAVESKMTALIKQRSPATWFQINAPLLTEKSKMQVHAQRLQFLRSDTLNEDTKIEPLKRLALFLVATQSRLGRCIVFICVALMVYTLAIIVLDAKHIASIGLRPPTAMHR